MIHMDIRNAHVKAGLKRPIYIRMDKGFEEEGSVHKVGEEHVRFEAKRANWYEEIRNTLTEFRLTPTKINPCIFTVKGVILILYVDDLAIGAKDEQSLEDLTNYLKKK